MDVLLQMWADLLGTDDLTRARLEHLLRNPPASCTNHDMDALVTSEPALWSWRKVGLGHLKFVQSWENRPTRKEWRALKRLVRDYLPIGIYVEFRGCPKAS